MAEPESVPHERFETLKRTRDELRLQIHLGADEARREWEVAETLWSRLQSEMHRFASVAEPSKEKIGDAVSTLAHEVGVAYGRIGAALRREV